LPEKLRIMQYDDYLSDIRENNKMYIENKCREMRIVCEISIMQGSYLPETSNKKINDVIKNMPYIIIRRTE